MAELEQLPDATETTAITAPTTQTSSNASTKKKRKKRAPKPHILSQFTIRKPPWAYVHLQHLSSSESAPELDAVTAQLHLTAALSQFLGLHGSAIPFDILKLENQNLWIRLPNEDRSALVAAVGGWVSANSDGWRVKGWNSWDANAIERDGGQDLFTDFD